MITLDEYQKLSAQVRELQSQKDRADGVLATLMEHIKEKTGKDSIKAAKDMLSRKSEELATLDKEYNQKLAEFKDKWSDKLKELLNGK